MLLSNYPILGVYICFKVFKQRKQLIWNLRLHVNPPVIFSQTLKFTIP